MNRRTQIVTLSILALTAVLLAACAVPTASGPQIVIEDAWARQSPMQQGNGAAYMIIKNTGGAADALIGAQTAASEVVELHETTMENDVMRMRPVEGQRIEIPANGQVELKPGGLHIMLIGLREKLEPGATIELILVFEQGGQMTQEVEVRAVEGMNMGDGEMDMEHKK